MKRRSFLKSLFVIPFVHLLWSLRVLASPRQITDRVSRIYFGSCCYQDDPQPIWDRILDCDPDLFIFLGDNIYGDTYDMTELKAKYLTQAANPNFRRFRERIPMIATWDDHDYGANDAGHEYPFKGESKEMMLDFFGEAKDSARRSREGLYTSYYFGKAPHRLQIILLDLRWFRTDLLADENNHYIPNFDGRATLLGEEQWTWLSDELQKPADVRIIGSSSQLVSPEHRWEKWANFPADHARFYQLIDALNLRNLFVISGDMHYGEVSETHTPGGIPLVDITSSGLNLWEPAEGIRNPFRKFLLEDVNFGEIRIDWDLDPIQVSIGLRNFQGEATYAQTLAISRSNRLTS